MFFEQLLLQPLRKIELLDPWQDNGPRAAGTNLLAGAIVLRFDQTAVVCTSPLRYMQSQSGTFIATPGGDSMAPLGYRLTLTEQEDVDLMFPPCLCRKVIAAENWMLATDSIIAAAAPVLILAAIEKQSQAAWSVKLRFLSGTYHLSWRPDLDGCIEFAPQGQRHTIDRIAVTHHDDTFGWLHPGYPHPFVLDQSQWQSAQMSDWPWPIRKRLRSHCEPETIYRETLHRALAARFRQAPLLRQRLLALRYPVQVKTVPLGLYENLAAALRDSAAT